MPQVECAAQGVTHALQRHVVAEVVPATQRYRRQVQTAATDATVRHAVVAVGGGKVLVEHVHVVLL